jgi:hypothetical protein
MQVKTGIEQGSMRQFTANLRQTIQVICCNYNNKWKIRY